MVSSNCSDVFLVKRSSNVLYDNKRFAELALTVSRADEEELLRQLQSSNFNVDSFIDCIPQSLLLLDTIYSKFFLFAGEREQFPAQTLRADRLVRQLIWFLAKELDPGCGNGRKTAEWSWKLVAPRLRNLLRVVDCVSPELRRRLSAEKVEISRALEGLGLHGLVNFGDRNLIEIGEAVKQELSDHYHRVKAFAVQVCKLLQSELSASTYSINDLRGPVPSQSSHQRLMNFRLSEIKIRLARNERVSNLSFFINYYRFYF